MTFQIKLNLRLPASLTDDRKSRSKRKVACPITSLVTVYRIVPRIDVKTTILNNAKDHRFRALFPTNIKTDKSYADGHFDVVTRDIKLPKMEGWLEQPSPTKHQKTFVDLTDGKKGLAILNNGLPEYEIVRKGGKNIIALTLLRSVGWLSRGDFLTRPGNAGPSLPAPDAQCLGERIAEYSIVPHAGDYQKANLIYHGLRHNNPLKLFRAKTSGGTAQRSSGNVQLKEIPREGILPEEMSFVTIAPENLILSAIKKSERRKAIIVRVYNPTDKTIAGKICLFKKIRKANLVNLNEEVTEPIPLVSSDGRSVKLNIGRRKIATLELSI